MSIQPSGPRNSSAWNWVVRHWRGELSLPVSFWLAGLAGYCFLYLVSAAISAGLSFLSERVDDALWFALGSLAQFACFEAVAAWYFVGTWRAGRRHPNAWGAVACAVVVLGVVRVAIDLCSSWVPSLLIRADMVFAGDSSIPPYRITLLPGGRELEFAGGIKFGAVTALREALDAHPNVWAIHLSSPGGLSLVGRKLRKLIRERKLFTYVQDHCESACTIAFMGGIGRYLGPSGELGFHMLDSPNGKVDREEVSEMIDLLASAGVTYWFIEKVYSTPNTSIWYPSRDELAAANVVTGFAAAGDFASSARNTVRKEVPR